MDPWQLASGRAMALDRPRLMAILNVTPDSFYDGGRFADAELAMRRALELMEEGADIIDIGGESTRPGAEAVSAEEQIRRTAPVIEAIARERPDAIMSIDTTCAAVAQVALDAGASIINDTSAARDDGEMAGVMARGKAGVIVMHRLRRPARDQYSTEYGVENAPKYDDLLGEIGEFLKGRVRALTEAGVGRNHIVLDPGIGFGKSADQNWVLVRHLHVLQAEGLAVLSAVSRKSFLSTVDLGRSGSTPESRLPATLAVSLMHLIQGIRLFRVHDVSEHRQAFAAANSAGKLRANAE